MADQQQHIYKILFHNQGQIYEVYARAIYQSDLYGFIEVEDYIFGDRTKVVIDPGQDRLRTEFDGVQRSFIPMHSIVRIDEVEKEGIAKVWHSPLGLTPQQVCDAAGSDAVQLFTVHGILTECLVAIVTASGIAPNIDLPTNAFIKNEDGTVTVLDAPYGV